MKKRIITMALAVIMLLAVLTGCGDNASNPGNDTPTTQVVKLSVGTGAVGGSVYTTGSGWANVMNNVLTGRYELTAEQTGGTVANVSLIETGEVEIGIVATDILYGAYTGTASWANGVKYQKPLAMFTCDMPSLCPFTLAGSETSAVSLWVSQEVTATQICRGAVPGSLALPYRAGSHPDRFHDPDDR